MFTGIVEHAARITSVSEGTGFRRINVASVWHDTRVGESIAINGVCLTIAEQMPGELAFDVIPETLSKTNLGLLKTGDRVHVERALRASDRIDGHFVQGHVDGQAILRGIEVVEGETRLSIEPPATLLKYVVPRGSVCIDGVSLTVARVHSNQFDVALIPTTLQRTILGDRAVGWPFNFEADVLSKTIVSTLERMDLPALLTNRPSTMEGRA